MDSRNAALNNTKARSLGLKLIVVCTLALLMTVPALFVNSLVTDRTQRAAKVLKEISSHVGGPQTFLGPTIVIPYRVSSMLPNGSPARGAYVIFPAQAKAEVRTSTFERHRSLFHVPVFQADLTLESIFDLSAFPIAAPPGADFDWMHAEVIIGASDLRGAIIDPTLEGNGSTYTLAPSELADGLSFENSDKAQIKVALLGAKLSGGVKPPTPFRVVSKLKFSGAERIAVLAYGKTTHIVAQGDWRNPGFDGGSLPFNRTVSDKGFKAEWTIPFTARGVRAEGPSGAITGLNSTAAGVSFIEVADAYQSVNRSLKYVLLILGLVFLSYFGFEVTRGKRVHPAQYILVGLCQIIFYLLFLSLSERMGFDLGFLLAAGATVGLLSANASWVFASRGQGVQALGLFGVLYLLIYLLLRLEDNALLIGAISSFLAIALVMYLTRKVDWYGSPQLASADRNPTL